MEGGSEPQLLTPFPRDPVDWPENSKIVDFADRRGTLEPTTLPEWAHGPTGPWAQGPGPRAHGPRALGPWAHEPPTTFFSRNDSPSEISQRNYRQTACICVPRLFIFDDFQNFWHMEEPSNYSPPLVFTKKVCTLHIYLHIFIHVVLRLPPP